MAVAAAAQVDIARVPAFDPMRLSDRCVWNRVERDTAVGGVIDAVTLIRVLELHALQRRIAVDDGIRKTVYLRASRRHVTPEVRVQRFCGADEVDVSGRCRIDWRRGDIEIPPVVGRKNRKRSRNGAADGWGREGAVDIGAPMPLPSTAIATSAAQAFAWRNRDRLEDKGRVMSIPCRTLETPDLPIDREVGGVEKRRKFEA